MTTKRNSISVEGHGIRVQGNFITKKIYEELMNNELDEDDIVTLEELSDGFYFSGVSENSFRILLDGDEICTEVDEIPNHFTLKIPPEKEFLPFTEKKKYGLVMVEFEKGDWYEAQILIKDSEQMVFTNRRIEISPTAFFSFVNVTYEDQPLDEGETIVTSQQFYLISKDGSIKELIL